MPRKSRGKFYENYTNRIPSYIMDRQNYTGFTYKSPVTYLYLFTVYTTTSFAESHIRGDSPIKKCP